MNLMNQNEKFKANNVEFDDLDLEIVLKTQAGIPIVSNPFALIASSLGVTEDEVILRLNKLKESGFIRKMAGTPNHYKIGYTANAMSVWDIPDCYIDDVGAIFKSVGFVSHCYIRPRALPIWHYNLFAMVHGKSRDEVANQVNELKVLVKNKFDSVELIYSSAILKKTGIRIKGNRDV